MQVGHVTVWRDEPGGRGIARTGVTAILPGPADGLFRAPVPAGAAVLNGAGEMTGSIAIAEWGLVETPVYLTSTMAVGRILDGAVAAAVAADPAVGDEDVVIPVVGECDDSWLSRQRRRTGRGRGRGARRWRRRAAARSPRARSVRAPA